MGQKHTIVQAIQLEKSHPLSVDCFKMIGIVLPHMLIVFKNSKWCLEGALLNEKTYKLKAISMLSISKYLGGESKSEHWRLEFDFIERQVYYFEFKVDELQSKFKHQLVKKMHVVRQFKIRCPQKKYTLNVLEDAILNNNY